MLKWVSRPFGAFRMSAEAAPAGFSFAALPGHSPCASEVVGGPGRRLPIDARKPVFPVRAQPSGKWAVFAGSRISQPSVNTKFTIGSVIFAY